MQGKSQSERVRDAVDRKVRGVVDGTKQRLNIIKGQVGVGHRPAHSAIRNTVPKTPRPVPLFLVY